MTAFYERSAVGVSAEIADHGLQMGHFEYLPNRRLVKSTAASAGRNEQQRARPCCAAINKVTSADCGTDAFLRR